MGDRMDNIQPGAMHWVNRYIGNPLLSGTLNLFFRTGIRDAHCGMRGFRRDILPTLDLRTTGMEFASEMVIRASKEKLDIREFPISYAPRGGTDEALALPRRLAPSALPARPQPDAPLHRPRRCACSRSARIIALISLLQIDIFGRQWQLHSMIAGDAAVHRRHADRRARALRTRLRDVLHGREGPVVRSHARARYRLEHGLMLGGAILLVGLAIAAVDRHHLDRPRLRRSCRRSASPSRPRRLIIVGASGLLLVVPAVDPRSAPARRRTRGVKLRLPAALRDRGVVVQTAVLAGVPLLVILVVWACSPRPYYTGTNSIRTRGIVAGVKGGHTLCIRGLELPAQTALVELDLVMGSPRPAMALDLKDASGATIASSHVAGQAGARGKAYRRDAERAKVDFPIARRPDSPATVPVSACLTPQRVVTLGGTLGALGPPPTLDGKPIGDPRVASGSGRPPARSAASCRNCP